MCAYTESSISVVYSGKTIPVVESPTADLKTLSFSAFSTNAEFLKMKVCWNPLELENAALKQEIVELKAQIALLQKRLDLDSTTSSKPPSTDSDWKKRPPISSKTDKEPKAKGGQQGHAGDTLTFENNPDEVENHTPNTCPECGNDLSGIAAKKVTKRQVHDVVIKKRIVEHVVEEKTCLCGCCVSGKFPPNITAPVQYGPTIKANAVYLSSNYIGKDRLSDVLSNMFGMGMSDTTILEYENKLAKNLEGFGGDVLMQVRLSDVKGADETGHRINAKKAYIHVACTEKLSYFYASKTREYPFGWMWGVLVTDNYSAYNKVSEKHGYCNIHHLRELKAITKYDKEPWAEEMRQLLFGAWLCKKVSRINKRIRAYVDCRCDAIVEEALAYYASLPPYREGSKAKRPGHNLALRFKKKKEGILMFFTNLWVWFTNNLSEQALRGVKGHKKVSGGFRTLKGAQNFAAIRSLTETLRKNKINILDGIKLALDRPVRLHDFLPSYAEKLYLPPPRSP